MANDKNIQADWHAKNPNKASEYRAKTRQRYQENPDIRKCQNLRTRYGISLADMLELLLAQGNCCAICGGREPGGRWGNWHVDHNHTTGKVRGILCHGCNTGIGALGDSSETLEKAAAYIRER